MVDQSKAELGYAYDTVGEVVNVLQGSTLDSLDGPNAVALLHIVSTLQGVMGSLDTLYKVVDDD